MNQVYDLYVTGKGDGRKEVVLVYIMIRVALVETYDTNGGGLYS